MMRNTWLYAGASLFSAYLVFQSCQDERTIRTAQYAVNGQKLYHLHCQNCHGAKGEGLGALYPSLRDSLSLRARHSELPCLIRNGFAEMPPNPQLTPVEIAYVLTYLTNSFGNRMGLYSLEGVETALADCR